MGGKSVTASERKGILAVAAVTLLVTGAGLAVSRCDTASDAATPACVEVVYAPDPAAANGHASAASVSNEKKKSSKRETGKKKQTSASGKSAGKSASGKSSGKTSDVLSRSPRDESVPTK